MQERVLEHEIDENSNRLEPELDDEDYPIQEPDKAE
jgi:hypothetical protein